MITLLQNGAWLLNGQEIVEDTADSTTILNSKLGYVPEKKDAAAQTMAYNILQAHNTSDSKEQLKIKFDSISHIIRKAGCFFYLKFFLHKCRFFDCFFHLLVAFWKRNFF